MDYVLQFRAEYPNCKFETRAINCADGVTRLITFDPWYWQKLDFLLSLTDECDLHSITKLCIESIRTKDKTRFEKIFHDLLGCYIYNCYHGYNRNRKGIANDYWKPLF